MLFPGLGSVRAAEGKIFRPKVTVFHYDGPPSRQITLFIIWP